jgi:putative ABC transport system permease protein
MLRFTLRSLLSRKLRLLLSGLAVVLGVMAVSGALVVTDTIRASFDVLFETTNQGVDVKVTKPGNVDPLRGGTVDETPVPADLVDRVTAVPGVGQAAGVVEVPGARVVGRDGKVVVTRGPPSFGGAWRDDDLGGNGVVRLREGRAPRAPDEVAVNAGLAERAGFHVGDRIGVLTLQPKRTFTLVGIFGYEGGRDTLFGEARVLFTEPVAQRLMLGRSRAYSAVNVRAADGVSPEELRDAIRAAVGPGYMVRTAAQVADEQAEATRGFGNVVRGILLGFAGVALFVGVFLIINTFSILVAQRTRELALLRSLGSGRAQVAGSVLVEALLVAVVAATLGFAAGLGIAALLKAVMQSFSGADLPVSGLVVRPYAVVTSYAVGVVVTVLAATVPALRASRVPPVAAMREAARPDRPVTRLVVAGAVLTLAGAAAVATALAAGADGGALALLLAGVLLVFVGVALLSPAVSGPVVPLLGRVFSWSLPGRLGGRNSARNPRRTAITASALMVGMAVVAGTGVLASSLKASIDGEVRDNLRAQLVVTGVVQSRFDGTYDPAALREAGRLPEVREAVPVFTDAAQVGSEVTTATAGDLPALARILSLRPDGGELRALGGDEVALDARFADRLGLSVGDTTTVSTARAASRRVTVAAVFEPSTLVSDVVLPGSARSTFRTDQATQGYVVLRDGADAGAVRRQVARLLEDNPEVTVEERADYVRRQTDQVDVLVAVLDVLVTLAVVIAVLGIVNTLALSVLERTRELGVVRAVGMRRAQVAGMVVVESVVISVFGALLGVVVGSSLGVAVVRALADRGLSVLSLPWSTVALLAALAVVAGVLAAAAPAVRAARVDVLRAIAHE